MTATLFKDTSDTNIRNDSYINKKVVTPRKSSLNDISNAAKEIAKIYEKETMYPYWFAYPFWWVALFIHVKIGGKDVRTKR